MAMQDTWLLPYIYAAAAFSTLQNQAVKLLNFAFESFIILFLFTKPVQVSTYDALRKIYYIFVFVFKLYHLCNISVLILYTQNKQQFPSVFFHVVSLFIYFVMTPVVFAQWLSV